MATAITDSRCNSTRAYHPTLAASCIKYHAKACMEAVPPVRPAVTPISVVPSLTVASGTTVAWHKDSPPSFISDHDGVSCLCDGEQVAVCCLLNMMISTHSYWGR